MNDSVMYMVFLLCWLDLYVKNCIVIVILNRLGCETTCDVSGFYLIVC